MKHLYLPLLTIVGAIQLFNLSLSSAQAQEVEDTLSIAQLAMLEGRPERSIELINSFIGSNQNVSEAWQIKAQAHRQLKEYGAAERSIKSAISIDPGNRLYLHQLANLQYEFEKYENCITSVDSLLKNDSLNRTLRILKAQSLHHLGNYEQAREVFIELYNEDTLNVWNIKQLAVLASRIDSVKEAISWNEKAVRLDSMDMRSYIRLGNLYVKAQEYTKGREELSKALSRDSSKALLYRFRGALSIMAADFDGAESDFHHAIVLGDSTVFSYRHYGLALFKQSKYIKAKEVYEKTVVLDPGDAQAWYYLGFCFKWQQDIPRAIECLDKALLLSATPGIADVYNGLGQFYGLQRMYQKAIHNYSRAYEWNPDDAVPLAEIGMLVEESGGKKEHAKDYYTAFLKNADPMADMHLIVYVNGLLKRINEQLFMEGKLERDN